MKKERLAHGWGLREFAALTSLNVGHLSRIENGKRPPTENVTTACDAAVIHDRQPSMISHPYKELTKRLLKGCCEMCGQAGSAVEVHQVRKLADLTAQGESQPAWNKLMTKMRRKTIITCDACHEMIHAGKTTAIT